MNKFFDWLIKLLKALKGKSVPKEVTAEIAPPKIEEPVDSLEEPSEVLLDPEPKPPVALVNISQFAQIFKDQHSLALLSAALPGLNLCLEQYGITTKTEIASFLAQIGHESGQLRYRVENLNYSASGLRKVFGKYFPTAALAEQYARKPEKIANRVYANRIGNGPESSGDGWKFRGRGYLQLTGRENYTRFAAYKNISLEQAIKLLETETGAWESAGWYWVDRNLDRYDDDLDIRKETLLVNGGYNGLADRQEIFENAMRVL